MMACVISGVLLGGLCGGLFALAMRRQSMAWGLGAVVVSFLAISAGIAAVRAVAPEAVLPAGALAIIVFLAASTAAILKNRP